MTKSPFWKTNRFQNSPLPNGNPFAPIAAVAASSNLKMKTAEKYTLPISFAVTLTLKAAAAPNMPTVAPWFPNV